MLYVTSWDADSVVTPTATHVIDSYLRHHTFRRVNVICRWINLPS